MSKCIKLSIEPECGSWIVSVRLPGVFRCGAFIGADGNLTYHRRRAWVFDRAEQAYTALERLSLALREQYPGTRQVWSVKRCCAEILGRNSEE